MPGGPTFANQLSATNTWHVPQEQLPPQMANTSSKPASRMISITVSPSFASSSHSPPERVRTSSFSAKCPLLSPYIVRLMLAVGSVFLRYQTGKMPAHQHRCPI